MSADETRWHKGSRFWQVAPLVMLLMVGFSVLILFKFSEHGAIAVDRTFSLAMIFMGGAGAKTTVDSYKK